MIHVWRKATRTMYRIELKVSHIRMWCEDKLFRENTNNE